MIGELAGLGAALSFGLSSVLARRFMAAVAPEAGVLVSIVANVVVFGAVVAVAAGRDLLPPVHPWSIGFFVAGGLAGTLVGRNLSYLSIGRLGASLSLTVRLSNSIFTLLLGLVLLKELPRPWQLAGLAAVTVGLWISLRPAAATPEGTRRRTDTAGVLMALTAAAAFAAGDTMRRAGLHLTPAPVLGAAVGSTTAMLAHLVWARYHHSARWPSRAGLLRFDVLSSAILNTCAILLIYTGLRHAPVAVVSVLYNLQVLVALVVGPLILPGQERVTPWLAAGALVAMVGTAMILLG